MSCSNCYNGCTEIVSDKCVRYTGLDVPALGIQNGDSLNFVEASLIEFLTSTLNGVGIKPIVDPLIICNLVQQYLPECGEFTLNDYITALIRAACDLQVQVDAIAADLLVLNADYDVDCLTGVISSSDTHAVLQAVITKLCDIDVDLAALALDVDTNYVKLADLNSLIAAYIASTTVSSTKHFTKMVPYTVIEYYGALTGNFDVTGAGIVGTDWEKIYLCNGLNGTPDKRGRVGVGAIVGVGGGPMNPVVDPATPTNPNYALNGTAGANTVTLNTSQIPSHTHVASVTDPGHRHFILANDNAAPITFTTGPTPTAPASSFANLDGNYSYRTGTSALADATIGRSSSSATGVTVTNANAGSGGAHSNIQPVLACYYIMYIP
jgi:microcystin-dependent protein